MPCSYLLRLVDIRSSAAVGNSFQLDSRQMQQLTGPTGATPVLKPTVFQDFELTEKTILSHNTAMSVLPPSLRIYNMLTRAATASRSPLRPPSLVSQSVNTSPSRPCFRNQMAQPKKLSDLTPQSRATTNRDTSTSSSSPIRLVISLSTWLPCPSVKRSRSADQRAQWFIHLIWSDILA